jgi:hypothetical protein
VLATGAIAAMLLVRRRAPEGSYFADGDRVTLLREETNVVADVKAPCDEAGSPSG